MRAKPYPKYKPSGVEWLGDVPEHWKLGRIGALFRLQSGGTPSTEVAEYWGGDIPWVSAKDMKCLRITTAEDHITSRAVNESATSLVPAGSALIVARSGILKHTLPVAVSEKRVAINQDIKGLLPHRSRIYALFFAYLLQGNQETLLTLWRQQGATVESLDTEKLKVTSLPLPPVDEQQYICDFLERETTKIETLIGKNRELIERLKEKRAALISRTVTRGLPRSVALAAGLEPSPKPKLSGTTCLGDVPAHWRTSTFQRDCSILDCMHRTVSFVDDGIPLASIREVHGFEVELSNAKRTTEEEYLSLLEGGRRPQVGDIILSRNATVGDSAIVTTTEHFAMGQDVCLVRTNKHNPRYVLYLLHSIPIRQQLESFMIGATFRRINVGQIKSLWACWPPRMEQDAIVEFLDHQETLFERSSETIQIAIDRLEEYRTALITAAVTGKIDVRAKVVDNVRHLASA